VHALCCTLCKSLFVLTLCAPHLHPFHPHPFQEYLFIYIYPRVFPRVCYSFHIQTLPSHQGPRQNCALLLCHAAHKETKCCTQRNKMLHTKKQNAAHKETKCCTQRNKMLHTKKQDAAHKETRCCTQTCSKWAILSCPPSPKLAGSSKATLSTPHE